MSNIINNKNINEYRESINGNVQNAIKSMVLNRIEVAHSNLLKKNQVTEEMLDDITYAITDSDEVNDYIDSWINDEIKKYIKENELEENEDEEEM